METFRINVPANFYVGKPDNYTRIGLDTIYYVAADTLVDAQDLAVNFIGEFGSSSFGFDVQRFSISEIIEQTFTREADQRGRGYYSTEEAHLRSLIKRTAFDLGSISIDRMILVLANNDKRFIGARIEASEGDRRRVVYLNDAEGAFVDYSADAIVRAVEAKF